MNKEKEQLRSDIVSDLCRISHELLELRDKTNDLSETSQEACGALGDIVILVTRCVATNASEDALILAESVLGRILSSKYTKHHRPSWLKHDFEKRLYDKYKNNTDI